MASFEYGAGWTWRSRMLCRPVGVAVVSAALFAFGTDAEAQVADGRRMALVIGNSAYAHTAALRNPVNDAVAVGKALRGLGFDVTVETDLDRDALFEAVGDFGERSASAEIAILFYAGHGIEVYGTNYLVPVDARLTWDRDIHQAMPLGAVLNRMQGTGLRLVILDACRDNPLARRMQQTSNNLTRTLSRSGLGGLQVRDVRGGTLVWYATAAGETVPDGNGQNSPFTRALLEHLDDPVEIGRVFTRTTRAMYEATRRRPYVYGTRVDEFFLNGSGPPPPPPDRPGQDLLWETALDSRTARAYEDYLRWYPDGWYADEAEARLAELRDPPPLGKFRDCRSCPEMVVIPAGTFMMGSPVSEEGRHDDEGPQHEVTVKSFALGVKEVTFDEWGACVRDGGCNGHRPGDEGWGRGARPVINVSWENARAYVQWLSDETEAAYRLPSESEWEYAARAGETEPFHTGATISTDQANYDGNHVYGSGRRGTFRERTTPVGNFAPNRFGLFNVHGNVWEWVEDCWHDNYQEAPEDGSAWTDGGDCDRRVVRGGSWNDDPRFLRSAARGSRVVRGRSLFGFLMSAAQLKAPERNRVNNVGFRVARTLD